MTSIFIKSFNRAFYLDRCLASIYKNVSGSYHIIILDDGTPEQYLEKIKNKYPDAEIRKSENHSIKTTRVAEYPVSKKDINGHKIPTAFWYENVKNATDYVIVTEDDVWFTQPVNIDQLRQHARLHQIGLIKLGWLGNHTDMKAHPKQEISENLEAISPSGLRLLPRPLMEAFFTNRFKFFSMMYKLRLADHASHRKYWALNSILMGFFDKNYWLEIWSGMDGRVDEKKQLLNAAMAYKKNKSNPNFIAKLKTEAMRTTFQSSATNSYHSYGYGFDANVFNHLINKAWLQGRFDAMENFPKDFSRPYLNSFIEDHMDVREFAKWADHFKNQYATMGCTID